jgi:hypothetical protein
MDCLDVSLVESVEVIYSYFEVVKLNYLFCKALWPSHSAPD